MIDDILKYIKEKGGITKAFLDYDGTLVNLTSDPKLAVADKETIDLVRSISSRIPTYIITGRALDSILPLIGPGFMVIALHGAQFLDREGKVRTIEGFDEYVRRSRDIASRYKYLEKMFPGLKVLDKGGGVQFHYYNVHSTRVRELEEVVKSISEECFELYAGKYIFELRIKGVNKGTAIRREMNNDFILFAGDDETDEEAFRVLRDQVTVKIGDGITDAKFRLKTPDELKNLLSLILEKHLTKGD